MGAIAWRRQLSVGQPSIDDDHRHLIDYLNELDAALTARVYAPARVAKTLMKLLEYTHQHFQREERIMAAVHFPKLEEHKRRHVEAVKAIGDLSNVFSKEPTRANGERIYAFTADWLVNHIIMEDTQIAPYVRGVWV